MMIVFVVKFLLDFKDDIFKLLSSLDNYGEMILTDDVEQINFISTKPVLSSSSALRAQFKWLPRSQINLVF